MKILGIETSCDETSAAVVADGIDILSSVVLSQTPLHRKFSGVVPEIASRAHLEKINAVVALAMKKARASFRDIDALAVSNRPGLVGSLIIGTATAKTLSSVFSKPLIPVNHVTAHLYSCFLGTDSPPRFPFIGLVVSGGHTLLIRVESWTALTIMGTTIDDAAGEAFDKVAKLLGLPYPGGPSVERCAKRGNPRSVPLPEINMYNKEKGNYNFSYSGLKTAVLYYMKRYPRARTADVCASFQRAAIDILVKKTVRLAAAERVSDIVVAGGVSANAFLRKSFSAVRGFGVFLPPKNLSTDNAAMVAGLAACLVAHPSGPKIDFNTLNVYAKNDIPYGPGARHAKHT